METTVLRRINRFGDENIKKVKIEKEKIKPIEEVVQIYRENTKEYKEVKGQNINILA